MCTPLAAWKGLMRPEAIPIASIIITQMMMVTNVAKTRRFIIYLQ